MRTQGIQATQSQPMTFTSAKGTADYIAKHGKDVIGLLDKDGELAKFAIKLDATGDSVFISASKKGLLGKTLKSEGFDTTAAKATFDYIKTTVLKAAGIIKE